MKKQENPFHLRGYHGLELFCDRKEETKQLISNIKNGVNTTLISIRRMGKTGLMHHTFNTLSKEKAYQTIYIDIYATQNLTDLTNQIASSILKAFPQNKSIGSKFIKMLKGFSPILSYDTLTDTPIISLSHTIVNQEEHSLKALFEFLEQLIDSEELRVKLGQQAKSYTEKNFSLPVMADQYKRVYKEMERADAAVKA